MTLIVLGEAGEEFAESVQYYESKEVDLDRGDRSWPSAAGVLDRPDFIGVPFAPSRHSRAGAQASRHSGIPIFG
jgi:hypothetical protein